MKRYKGDLALVAAAYNAGIGTVSRYGGVPPYAETQEYVSKVTALYELYLRALGKKAAPERPRCSGGIAAHWVAPPFFTPVRGSAPSVSPWPGHSAPGRRPP